MPNPKRTEQAHRATSQEPTALAPLIAFGLLVIVVAAVLWSALPASAQEAVQVNRIILRVNDKILTLHDYEKAKGEQINRVLANPSLDAEQRQETLSRIGKLLVKSRFDEMLVLSRARQLSVVVDETQVDETLGEMRQAQGIDTEDALRQALVASGMTLDEVRDGLRRDLVIREVMGREVQSRVTVSDDQVRLYYREHQDEFVVAEERQLREVIVYDSSGLDDDQRREVAEKIIAAVGGGQDLDEAVAAYKDQGLTSGVVDLGWLKASELGPALRDAAWALEQGAYSAPVVARGGLHILHLEALQGGDRRAFGEVEEQIRAAERNRLFGREVQLYMAELAGEAFIVEDLPPDAVGYRALAGEIEEPEELQRFRAPELAPELAPEADDESASGSS